MFYLLYLELLIVATLLKLNVEIDDLRYPIGIYLFASIYFNLLIGNGFFSTVFLTLIKFPFVCLCFWGVKRLENKHYIYWVMSVLFSSQFLMVILIH